MRWIKEKPKRFILCGESLSPFDTMSFSSYDWIAQGVKRKGLTKKIILVELFLKLGIKIA